MSLGQSNTVDVVIRCRNCAEDLKACLQALASQCLPAGCQLVAFVVDNESTDDSPNVARSFGAKVIHLPAGKFSWGGALNLGIAAGGGDLVILLSADAWPANEHWLSRMLIPFLDKEVAVVYGRQIPKRNAPIDERLRLARDFGDVSAAYTQRDIEVAHDIPIISNSCAAIRRSVWVSLPYDETVAACEDRVWAAGVLSKGYKIYYQASACVYHSHADTVGKFAWRQWEFYEKRRRDQGREVSVMSVLRTCAAIPKSRLRDCLSLPGYTLSKSIALARVPIETFLFLTIAATSWHSRTRAMIRSILWG